MKLTITIDDTDINRLKAWIDSFVWQNQTLTYEQKAQELIVKYIKKQVKSIEISQAKNTAISTIAAQSELKIS